MTRKWNYFNDDEVKGLDNELVAMLDMARHIAGTEFVITSGLRTEESNSDVNGIHDSSHMKGLAVDIACELSGNRFKIVKSLINAGFNRIGIYPKHIHCDVDETKPRDVIWIKMT